MRLCVGEPLEAKRLPVRTAHMHRHEATMGMAGPSLGRELRARALSHTAPVPGWHRLRSSVTKSRTDCDLTQQMVGDIKPSSPGMKSMSADVFLDLTTMSAPSGEERTPGASVHRSSALDGAAAALT